MLSESTLKPVVLVLTSNERYFPGLYCAILSALAHMNRERQVKIYVLDGGLSEQSKFRLVQAIQCYKNQAELRFLSFDTSIFSDATIGPSKSYMSYGRILMPELIKEPRIIYLDSDVLVFRDLSVLYDLSLENNKVLAAVPDAETLSISDDSEVIASRLKVPSQSRYFNCGIMLINLEDLRSLGFTSKSIEFLNDWAGCYRFHDQSAINFLLYGKIQPLPEYWDCPGWKFDQQAGNLLNKVVHYTNAIPWLETKRGPAQVLFEEYAAQLGLVLDRSTLNYRKSQLRQIWLNIIAPLRVICYFVMAISCKILGRIDQSKGYAKACRFWRNYILNTPYRHCLYHRRVKQIRNMKFNVGGLSEKIF